MTLRLWAEQTTCVICNSGTQKVDETNCATCHSCSIKMRGTRNACERTYALELSRMWTEFSGCTHCYFVGTETKKIAALETVPEDSRSLKLEVTALKPKYSSVVQRTTQNENNSLNPTYRTENGIFGFVFAGQSKATYQPFRSRFNSTNSSKRQTGR